MESIGFIGVGSIGGPMAGCLMRAGYALTVCDISPQAREKFRQGAVRVTEKPTDCAKCSTIIVMVATDSQVREVMLAPHGVLEAVNPEQPPFVAIMSTILPQTTHEVASHCTKKNVHVVDAAVSGGPVIAEQGELTIMVGGEKADFEVMRPIFKAMGENIYHCGPLGTGDVAKLVNNMVGAPNFFLMVEAMLVAGAYGMDLSKLLSILEKSSGRNFLTEDLKKARGFLDSFSKTLDAARLACEFGRKDLGHVQQLAREVHLEVPLLDQIVLAVNHFSPEEIKERWQSVVGELSRLERDQSM